MVVGALIHGLPELLDLLYIVEHCLVSFSLRAIRRRVRGLQHLTSRVSVPDLCFPMVVSPLDAVGLRLPFRV